MKTKTKRIYPKEAIEFAANGKKRGGKAALARMLGISRAMVGQLNPRRPLAEKYVDILKAADPEKFGDRS
jgi:hypothetical protein